MSSTLLNYSLCPPCHGRLCSAALDGETCPYCDDQPPAASSGEIVCIICSIIAD
jgi:hypothetical protein